VGLVQASYLPPSSAHSKATPLSASVNPNVALALLDGLAGFCAIAGLGGAVVSILHV
jgi:hypothetical protein